MVMVSMQRILSVFSRSSSRGEKVAARLLLIRQEKPKQHVKRGSVLNSSCGKAVLRVVEAQVGRAIQRTRRRVDTFAW